MITIVKTMPDRGSGVGLPDVITTTWEGELPAVGDGLLNISVRVDCASNGPEIGGFNNSVPKYRMVLVQGIVAGRAWEGPGIIVITYDHEGRIR